MRKVIRVGLVLVGGSSYAAFASISALFRILAEFSWSVTDKAIDKIGVTKHEP